MSIVKIIADVRENEQSRVALIEDGKLAEIFIDFNDDGNASVRQGDIFKARVETLVPSIRAAFVKLSKKSHGSPSGAGNAFMYINEASDPSSIKPGHEIIVQVVRSARKNKAPRVTLASQFQEDGSYSFQTATKQEYPAEFLTPPNENASKI